MRRTGLLSLAFLLSMLGLAVLLVPYWIGQGYTWRQAVAFFGRLLAVCVLLGLVAFAVLA